MILFTDKYMLAIGMLASFIYAAVEFCIMQRKSHKYPYHIIVYITFRLLVVSCDGGFFISALIFALYAETDTDASLYIACTIFVSIAILFNLTIILIYDCCPGAQLRPNQEQDKLALKLTKVTEYTECTE